MDLDRIEDLLYKKSGLLGISGVSNDVRDLLASDSPLAAEAIEFFVYRIVREIGSLTAALGGLDALIFTAGIGENSPVIRRASLPGPRVAGRQHRSGCQPAWKPMHFSRGTNSIGVGDSDR